MAGCSWDASTYMHCPLLQNKIGRSWDRDANVEVHCSGLRDDPPATQCSIVYGPPIKPRVLPDEVGEGRALRAVTTGSPVVVCHKRRIARVLNDIILSPHQFYSPRSTCLKFPSLTPHHSTSPISRETFCEYLSHFYQSLLT